MKDKSNKKKRKRSRHQKRTSATRQSLLEAASQVFAERGLDLSRIEDITERADVGKGTFYYHFRGKEGLIRELIKDVLGQLTAALEEKCGHEPDLPGLLDNIIRVHIDFFSNRWEDFVLYFQGRADLTLQEGYQGIETPFIDYLNCMENLLSKAIKFSPPKPVLRRIACAVAGFLSGYYSFAVISTSNEDIDEAFRSLRGAMVASLARFVHETLPAEKGARVDLTR